MESKWKISRSFPPSTRFAALICFLCLSCGSIFRCGISESNAATVQRVTNSFLNGGTDSKSYFYIYEWPSFMDDVWPPPNATLHTKSGYDHGFYANRGAGVAIDSNVGLFQTWQFSLYKNLMARLRTSEFRTRDPSKATAFLIPFDLGDYYYDALKLFSLYCMEAGQCVNMQCREVSIRVR